MEMDKVQKVVEPDGTTYGTFNVSNVPMLRATLFLNHCSNNVLLLFVALFPITFTQNMNASEEKKWLEWN